MASKKAPQTKRNIGDIYRPVAKVAKVKNGVESVLIIRGMRYVLEHPDQFKGFSLSPARIESHKKSHQSRFNNKKGQTHQRDAKSPQRGSQQPHKRSS